MIERAGSEKRTPAAGVEDRAGIELRRIGFVFRNYGESGAGRTARICSREAGGAAVLAETTEIFGAEHLLVRRARNRQVAEKLLGFVDRLQEISDAIRRQLRRQSVARKQRRRADQYSRKIAGRGGQSGHLAAERRRGLRRAGQLRPGSCS